MSLAPPSPRAALGVTLIELMVTIAVMAVLLAVALPSFASFIRQWQQDAAVDAFVSDLRLARSTATRTSRRVALCPRKADACDTGRNWAAGWLVFSDFNQNGTLDPGEPVIAQRDAPAGVAAMTGPSSLGFRSNGTLNTLTASVNIFPVGANAAIPGADIDITASGRISVEAVAAAQKGPKQP